MKKFNYVLPAAGVLAIPSVLAHCPLCTIGAAAAAGGAAYFGVESAVIGVFLGAFAASMGWWVSRLIKKQYVPHQRLWLVLFSFATTIFPLLPLLGEKRGFLVAITGGYGTWLNTTYIYDVFLVGSFLGLAIVCAAPWISDKATEWRGKMLPFQGMGITFALLVLAGIILQVVY